MAMRLDVIVKRQYPDREVLVNNRHQFPPEGILRVTGVFFVWLKSNGGAGVGIALAVDFIIYHMEDNEIEVPWTIVEAILQLAA
jgi:hypothetical protein